MSIIKTIYYTYLQTTARIVNKGTWHNVRIVNEYKADDGSESWSEEVLTFAYTFTTESDAEEFMKSKLFKAVLKQCQKNKLI